MRNIAHMTTTEKAARTPQWDQADGLSKARRESGMSLDDMAEALGIGRRSVSAYESGQRSVRRGIVIAWAAVTGVDPGWLLSLPVRPKGFEPLTFWCLRAGAWASAAARRAAVAVSGVAVSA